MERAAGESAVSLHEMKKAHGWGFAVVTRGG
jgi:hypothetical protein